jgi:hypothetical protein
MISTESILRDIKSTIGEGVHTSLRKFCESNESQVAWMAIRDIPEEEWENVCGIVATEIIKIFSDAVTNAIPKACAGNNHYETDDRGWAFKYCPDCGRKLEK